MPIVHAIPGSGKTHAAREAGASGRLVDSDVLFKQLFGTKASKQAMDDVLADRDWRDMLFHRYANFSRYDSRFILLSNANPDTCGGLAALRVAYAPSDYVEHLHLCGRTDLIEKFGEATLRTWAEDHARLSEHRFAPRTIWLPPGRFLSNVGVIAEQDYAALNAAAARRVGGRYDDLR